MRPGLYLCDNGAALCHDHLGITARTTGRDISGQRIYRLSAREIEELQRQTDGRFGCETCLTRRGGADATAT